MKPNPLLRQFAMLSAFVLPTSLQALEVHEWGTFTVLVSSDGRTTNWYQPYSDIAQLPPFTYDFMTMKSSFGAAQVRMETPVIYFYPEKEMDVQVRVAFQNGQITERFPAATLETFQPNQMGATAMHRGLQQHLIAASIACVITPKSNDDIFNERLTAVSEQTLPKITTWRGKLLPPNHPSAKLIPSVAGHKGENYGAAREVPDAWIFHSETPPITRKDLPTIHPVEKFIFYRGAGHSVPPYTASMSDDQTVSFSSYAESGSTFQIALRVKDGQASWIKMSAIPAPTTNSDFSTKITFPETSISLEQADKELSKLFITELARRGLTVDEAKAMVKTWNHTWFTEPGQRVFTIVDRDWVDSTLPLSISPNPEKVERVFVARYEIISPEAEEKLDKLMHAEIATEQAAKDFKALKLGRFANGAAELVAERKKSKALNRYHALNQKAAEVSK